MTKIMMVCILVITFALATNHGNAWGVQARVLRARKRA